MISRVSLSKLVSPAVLSRAAIIADRGLLIHDRTCEYKDGLTSLRAVVDAANASEIQDSAHVILDEEKDQLVRYACTCEASRKFGGPCRHCVALCLDFNDRPHAWTGFDESHFVTTSTSIARYLARTPNVRLGEGAFTEHQRGSVVLVPQLIYNVGGFGLRFEISGDMGSYVLKSLGDFVDAVDKCAYVRYGKKLAFTHAPDSFSPQSWRVVQFLERAIRNRRSYALDKLVGRSFTGTYHTNVREIHLSAPELQEFLELYLDQRVHVADASKEHLLMPHMTSTVLTIQKGDPEVSVELVELTGGSFEFMRHGSCRFVHIGDLCLACDGEYLLVCSDAVARAADVIADTFNDPSQHLLISKKDAPTFAALVLPVLEKALKVSVPAELERLRPQPLELTFLLDYGKSGASCRVEAHYGEATYAILTERSVDTANIQRNFAGESLAREVVLRYLPVIDSSGKALLSRAHSRSALATLVYEGTREMARLGKVLCTESFKALRSSAKPVFHVGVSYKSHLIDLTITTSGIEREELRELLETYRQKKRYYHLKDGSILDLDTVDLQTISDMAETLGLTTEDLEAGHAHIPSYKAFLLEHMVDKDAQAESFKRYLEDFRSYDPASFAVPASLVHTLRPYQVTGYQWMCALTKMGLGGILADEMGLGKSVQLIALLVAHVKEIRSFGPALIVCPASLVYNWQAEFSRFAPSLNVRVVAGSVEERSLVRKLSRTDVMITSYELLRRDIEDYAKLKLWAAVLDEAQYIKNHETLSARSVKLLVAKHRFALTGTPVENRLSELWSIFDFLMPGLLGSYERFRERFERPMVEEEDELAAKQLKELVGPFIMRRLKKDVLRDLPDKLEQVVLTHMVPEQEKLYAAVSQELRDALMAQKDDDFGRSKLQVLSGLMRLRQICCDPHLVFESYEGTSAKLGAIMDIVEQVVDAHEKMLIFSQFTSYLNIIAQELDKRGYAHAMITGQTPKKRRLELVNRFNEDATPVFLISLKAGGTGLNLTSASVVVHADPWWNAAAQNQATDRAHRIGQTKRVVVYKVICEHTLEERILEMQERKRALADEVMDTESHVSLKSLTKDDMLRLLQ
ncbi:MAG: DEAD/DEAH box helicase [Atopobiaceae bacterium]